MKSSAKCPKCGGVEILRIPGIAGAYGSGNVIPTGGLTIWSSICVTRYLCAGCGFSEEWIDRPEDIERLRKMSARESMAAALDFLQGLAGAPKVEKFVPEKPDGNN